MDTDSALVVAQLLFLEAEETSKPIHVYVNSPGGSVTAGLAIYDTVSDLSIQQAPQDIMAIERVQDCACEANDSCQNFCVPHKENGDSHDLLSVRAPSQGPSYLLMGDSP